MVWGEPLRPWSCSGVPRAGVVVPSNSPLGGCSVFTIGGELALFVLGWLDQGSTAIGRPWALAGKTQQIKVARPSSLSLIFLLNWELGPVACLRCCFPSFLNRIRLLGATLSNWSGPGFTIARRFPLSIANCNSALSSVDPSTASINRTIVYGGCFSGIPGKAAYAGGSSIGFRRAWAGGFSFGQRLQRPGWFAGDFLDSWLIGARCSQPLRNTHPGTSSNRRPSDGRKKFTDCARTGWLAFKYTTAAKMKWGKPGKQ